MMRRRFHGVNNCIIITFNPEETKGNLWYHKTEKKPQGAGTQTSVDGEAANYPGKVQ